MAHYRIHRLKEAPRETFRWAAHTGGLAIVKPKDYEALDELEAANAYAAWQLLKDQNRPLHPGDLLETIAPGEQLSEDLPSELKIAKYIGFEPAQWFVPELMPTHSLSSSEAPRPANLDAETL